MQTDTAAFSVVVLRRTAKGTVAGGVAGGGYGIHKSLSNNLSIDPQALNLNTKSIR